MGFRGNCSEFRSKIFACSISRIKREYLDLFELAANA